MRIHRRTLARTAVLAVGGALSLAGCAMGGPGSSTYYECERGTLLKVDFTSDGALVRVDNGNTQMLRQVPAASGAAYEGRGGWRLHTKGDEAVWIAAARAAPETCSQVAVPR